MKQLRGKYLLVIIALCGVICAGPGLLINSAGLYFTPVAEDLGIGRGTVSFAQTLVNLGFAFGSVIAARILSSGRFRSLRLGPLSNWQTYLTGSLAVYALSTAALALCGSVPALYAVSIVRGLASGITGMVFITTTLNNWFYGSAGFVTSIVMGSCGIVSAAFSPFLNHFITSFGWRTGYVVNACMVVLLYLPALLFPIRYMPAELGMPAMGQPEQEAGGETDAPQRPVLPGVFALAMVIAFLCAFTIAYPGHFPGIADSYGLPAAVGAAMLSVTMVFNTVGKLIYGAMVDRIGNRISMLVYCCGILLGTVLLLTQRSVLPLYAAAGLFGLGYTFSSMSTVLICKDLFGRENYNRVYPKISLLCTIANALITSFVGFVYDASKSYAFALAILIAATVLNAALTLTAYRKAGAK